MTGTNTNMTGTARQGQASVAPWWRIDFAQRNRPGTRGLYVILREASRQGRRSPHEHTVDLVSSDPPGRASFFISFPLGSFGGCTASVAAGLQLPRPSEPFYPRKNRYRPSQCPSQTHNLDGVKSRVNAQLLECALNMTGTSTNMTGTALPGRSICSPVVEGRFRTAESARNPGIIRYFTRGVPAGPPLTT
jgi:hypothetical protein